MVAEVKVDVVVTVEKCDVLTSSWREDRYIELLCLVEKITKEKKRTLG
jgi:hypothetical protein